MKPADVPNSYEDLLNPRWVGKIALEAGDTDWFASMVKSMGEAKGLAFFRKLAQMRPQVRTGHTLMGELVASGEIPLAASIYNHNAERLAVKGAPIKWKALKPTFGRPNAVAVAKRAQHPIKERNRVPASPKVDTQLNKFPYEMIDPALILDEADKWEKRWSELFLKGQAVQKDRD